MKFRNYIKNIFFGWFLLVSIFSNFELLHTHSFKINISYDKSGKLLFSNNQNYTHRISACFLDDFLLTIKSIFFEKVFQQHRINNIEFSFLIPSSSLLEALDIDRQTRGPPMSCQKY